MPIEGVVIRPEIGLALAEQLLVGVRTEAARRGLAVAAAVVDRGGQLVAAARMDGTAICGVPIAVDKAYSAVACAAPTDTWAARTAPGGPDWGMSTALSGRMVVYPGGLPITYDGEIIGGLGVSGADGNEDRACAAAALAVVGLAE